MSGHTRPRVGTAVAAILTMLLTVSVTACQAAPSKSVSAKQTPAPTPTPTLTACPVVSDWPVRQVTAAVVAVVTQYYTAKHLTPITIYKDQETVLDVKEQSVGVHYCRNLDGGTAGYVGAVPLTATAAVMVYVKHQPYPTTQTPSNFVTLAQMPGTGWTVVAEGTGP